MLVPHLSGGAVFGGGAVRPGADAEDPSLFGLLCRGQHRSGQRTGAVHQPVSYTHLAYTGDQILIDGEGKEVRIDHIMPYRQSESRAALLYLWLGRNLYIDFAFFRRDIYCSKIKNSYLDANMPYWLDLSHETKCLNVINMDFPMFRYRVFEGNYINNEIGKLNVINGELRTLTNLMKYFYVPAYRLQYVLYRIVNKLRLGPYFIPFYRRQEEKNKGQIVRLSLIHIYRCRRAAGPG